MDGIDYFSTQSVQMPQNVPFMIEKMQQLEVVEMHSHEFLEIGGAESPFRYVFSSGDHHAGSIVCTEPGVYVDYPKWLLFPLAGFYRGV